MSQCGLSLGTFIVSLHFPPKAHNQTQNRLLFTPALILSFKTFTHIKWTKTTVCLHVHVKRIIRRSRVSRPQSGGRPIWAWIAPHIRYAFSESSWYMDYYCEVEKMGCQRFFHKNYGLFTLKKSLNFLFCFVIIILPDATNS